jgi:hypothetical protein
MSARRSWTAGHRTYARLAELPAGSQQKRQLASAIRGMEREQLRRRIHRAHTELRHLPPGSDERRKLAQALDEMEDEYSSRLDPRPLTRVERGRRPDRDRGRSTGGATASLVLPRAPHCRCDPRRSDCRDRARLSPPQGVPGPDAGALDPPSPTAPRLLRYQRPSLALGSAHRVLREREGSRDQEGPAQSPAGRPGPANPQSSGWIRTTDLAIMSRVPRCKRRA